MNRGLDSSNVVPPPVALDVAAIEAELLDALDQIDDDALRGGARSLAQRHYEDNDLPAATRAFAASVVGQAYLVEALDAEACDWYRRASVLATSDTTYTSTMTLLGCTL